MKEVSHIDTEAVSDMTRPPTDSGRSAQRIWHGVEVVSALVLVLMMLHIVANALLRTYTQVPLKGASEYVSYWYLPTVAFAGIVLAQVRRQHIDAPLLVDRLRPRSQVDAQTLSDVLCLFLSVGFAYYGLTEALENRRIGLTAGVTEVIIWPATFLMPLCFIALAFQFAGGARAGLLNRDLSLTQRAANVRSQRAPRVWIMRLVVSVALVVCLLVILGPFTRESVGVVSIAMMIVLVFLRVPVGFALLVPGILGVFSLAGWRAVENMLGMVVFAEVSKWQLTMIPMFVLMGLLLSAAGAGERVYMAARAWLGWLPGGLAVGTNVAGAGLAAISGSTIGTTYTLGRTGIPEMLRAGYDRRLAVGSVLTAGLPGQLIPPSIFLMIYAGIANVPVGPQLIAGIVPGLVVAAVYSLTILTLCIARPNLAGRGSVPGDAVERFSWAQRFISANSIWPIPILIAVIVMGMFTGVLTATEAGGAGAFGAAVIALWYRRSRFSATLAKAAVETVIVTGSIFLLLIGAQILARLLAISGIGSGFADWVIGLGLTRVQFLFVLFVAYLILGMFLDPLSMMLLTVPLLLPTLEMLSISPIWFGVFVVFMSELAILTPPVGILTFIVHKIVQDPEVNLGQSVSLGDVFRSVIWFLPVAFVVCALLILVPEIVTYLPGKM